MYFKLFFKKLFKPYDFKYIHTNNYYLNLFYDELVNLDSKIQLEHDKKYVNHLILFSELDENQYIFKFRDCLESLGFKVETKLYKLEENNVSGVIFTVYLDNLWEVL